MPNILIVNTPGPQGPVGPQGIQGPSGSLSSASSGSYSITGSLTISGSLETIGTTSLTNVNISGSGNFTEDVNITGSLKFKGNTNNLYFAPSTDVRNWYLTNKNISVTSQETSPQGIYFKNDGTRFYIIGFTADSIFQYDLSTPWDVSTAVYNSINLSVSAQDTAPTDLFISSDGTILFIVGGTNDRVYRYDLSSAWDISSATFVNFFSVTSEETNPHGLYFDPTGTNMYVVGATGDDVNQYTLGTAWDLTTVSFLQTFSVASQESSPTAISFNNSGTRMYILGQTGDDINEYRLSTPWDISTAVFFTTGFTSTFETAPGGLYYNETYEVAYIVGIGADTVYGLKATPQLKYYGNSFVMDSQVFIEGRTEIGGTLYSNGTITTPSTMVVGSTFSNVNSSFSSAIITLGTGTSTNTVNIGGNATLSSINQFAYGAITSSLTKTVNIGTGGLTGSITNITIGSPLGGGKIILDQNTDFTQNTTINQTLNVNNNVNILDAAQTASGAIVVFDTFTETSNTLLNLHTPDTGSSWSRVQISTFTSPTMTVFGATDTAGPTATVSNEGVIYRQDTVLTTPNYEVSVNLVTQDTGDDLLWLFARYQDVNNWYGVKWSTTQANCALVKRVGGTFTNIATLSAAPITGTTTLSIRVQDNLIVVLNGGNVVMAVSDTSIVDAGYAAIGGGNIGQTSSDDFDVVWKFDNFTVRNYVAGAQTSNIVGGLNITGSLNATSITGSFSGSANLTSLLASSALVTGNVTVLGTASINTLVVNQTQLSTGSNQLGDAADDTQTLYGSVIIPTGSLTVTGSTIISSSASTQLQVGSNLLFVSSSGNVGIGTLSPFYRLDVAGNYRQTQPSGVVGLYYITSANANQVRGTWDFYTNTSITPDFFGKFGFKFEGGTTDSFKQFQIHVGDLFNPRLIVDGTGRTGIGTITPSASLHISGASSANLLRIDSPASSSILFVTGSGNVGIGTATPSQKLEVRDGFILVSGSGVTGQGITIARAGLDTYQLTHEDGGLTIRNSTDGVKEMTFLGNGNVGINETNPTARLEVKGSGTTSSTTDFRVENANSSASLVVLDDRQTQITSEGAALYVEGARVSPFSQNIAEFRYAGNGNSLIISQQNGVAGLTTSTNTNLHINPNGTGATVFLEGKQVRLNNSNNNGTIALQNTGTTGQTRLDFITGSSTIMSISGSGNVGIGTTTPGVTLDVIGNIRANSSMFNSTTQTQQIRINSTTHLAFLNTGSVEVARFDNAGNWGFGITSPLAKLHISGTNALRMQSTGFDTFEWFFSAGSGIGFRNVTDGTIPFFVGGTDDIGIGTTITSARLHISGASNSNLLRIDSPASSSILFVTGSGRVGIGTATPQRELDINGFVRLAAIQKNGGSSNLSFLSDSSGAVTLNIGGAIIGTLYDSTPNFNEIRTSNNQNLSINARGSGSLFLQTVDTTRLTITGSNVGIGTTTPSTTLNVNGTTLLQGGQTTVRGSGTTSATTSLRVENSSATDRLTILDDGTSAFNTNQLFISSSGFIGVGTTAVQATGNLIAARRDQDGTTSISVVNASNTTNSRSAVSVGVAGAAISMIAYPVSQSNTRLREKGVILTDTSVLNGIGVYTITGSIEIASKFSSNLNQLVISDNGNIGIGTSTPTASLHISGASSANLLRIDSPASSNILFVTGSGNIGIGTSTPTSRLTVFGGVTTLRGAGGSSNTILEIIQNTGSSVGAHFIGSGNDTIFELRRTSDGLVQTRFVPLGNSYLHALSGNVGIGTTSPTATLHISGASSANLLRIDSPASSSILFVTGSGRVGIGTNTPTSSLHIVDGGTSAFTSLQINTLFRFRGDGVMSWGVGTNQGILSWDTGRVIIGGQTGNNLDLYAGSLSSPRARLDTSGNMGLGTGTGTISARLHTIGAGSTSATTTFLLQNSTPVNLMTVLDNGQFTYTTPTMSLAASQSAYTISPIISASNLVGGQHYGLNITPTFFQTTASQTETAFRVAATFNQSSPSATSGSNIIADFGATSVGSQLTITDITSGSIYMVNDVSGLPILEATSDWTVNMYNFPNVVLQKTGSQVNINGTLRVSGSFILPLSQSTSPQTGSAYWSGSFLFVYDGTRYRSSSFA